LHARRAFQPPQPRRRDREVAAPGVVVTQPAQAAEPSPAEASGDIKENVTA
jgi:hypothetical protein